MAPGYGVRARTAGTFGPCRPFGSGLAARLSEDPADLRGVGGNLQDHPTAKVGCATPSPPPPVSRYN